MTILLTNDDGIDAHGLLALENAALTLPSARVVIVAPASEQSQCGHRVTTHQPLITEARGPDRYAVHGTPADCVRVALFGLHLKPDLVLSGINHGGNMGQDLVISGTVAAAREAAYHGIPAIALSHYLIRNLFIDWTRITAWTTHLLHLISAQPMTPGTFHNINFPHLEPGQTGIPPIIPTHPARSPLNVAYTASETPDSPGTTHYTYTAPYSTRPQDPGSDVEATFANQISHSIISL